MYESSRIIIAKSDKDCQKILFLFGRYSYSPPEFKPHIVQGSFMPEDCYHWLNDISLSPNTFKSWMLSLNLKNKTYSFVSHNQWNASIEVNDILCNIRELNF